MADTPNAVPDVNDPGNSLSTQAIGNKADAPATGPTASLHAKIASVSVAVGGSNWKLRSESEAPDVGQLDETISFNTVSYTHLTLPTN